MRAIILLLLVPCDGIRIKDPAEFTKHFIRVTTAEANRRNTVRGIGTSAAAAAAAAGVSIVVMHTGRFVCRGHFAIPRALNVHVANVFGPLKTRKGVEWTGAGPFPSIPPIENRISILFVRRVFRYSVFGPRDQSPKYRRREIVKKTRETAKCSRGVSARGAAVNRTKATERGRTQKCTDDV